MFKYEHYLVPHRDFPRKKWLVYLYLSSPRRALAYHKIWNLRRIDHLPVDPHFDLFHSDIRP